MRIMTALSLIILSLTVSAQNITNTLGTGGDYIIRDAANQYLTFKQSSGLMGLGAGVITPRSQLEIGGTEGLLVTGTYNSGTSLNLGAGTRLHWYPKKGAFRAGRVEGNQWDDDSIGTYSVAMGYNVQASNTGSIAMGYNTQASGFSSIAMGLHSQASGNYSTAIGTNVQASGESSTAMGVQTLASGYSSTAMGHQSIASGQTSTAMGLHSQASGNHSIAMGYNAQSSNTGSMATGYNTHASGSFAIAMGYNTKASGNYSTAMGDSSQASGAYSTAIGFRSIASGYSSYAIGSRANTNNKFGAMVITDDYDNGHVTTMASTDYELTMRFCGGYRLFTNSTHSTGVYMNAGESGWSNYCDRNKKENFKAIDNETLLDQLRGIPVTRWNYKGNPNIDYIGPMAQDFYAAFHLGGEDSLGINSICIDGVTLAGVKALEERTHTMKSEIDSLTAENQQIKSAFSTIQAENQQTKTAFSTIQAELMNLTGEYKKVMLENHQLSARIDQLMRNNRELKNQIDRDNRELKAQLARMTETLDRLAAREETIEPASPSASAVSHSAYHPERVTTILP